MKKFHYAPYTEETLVKLGIFRDYLRSWLPVFINRGKIYWHEINIVDFFSGQGCDINNISGSPLIIFEELQPYLELIKEKRIKVNIVLNEKEDDLFERLNNNIEKHRDNRSYSVKTENNKFQDLFYSYYDRLSNPNAVSLVFLDQFGIKEIDQKIFKMLVTLKRTDFLFFISSSIANRFGEEESISKHIKLNKNEVERKSYNYIHKIVYQSYKDQIENENYFLAPFSIKKGANIYGLIFGSHHPLGMQKFLTTAWKYDKVRGEANFDIENELIIENQLDLITENPQIANKLELFETSLKKKILNREIVTNKDIYLFTINQACIPKHARKVLKELHKANKIKNRYLKLDHKVCANIGHLEKIELV